jgi:hypothetical protein
MGMLTFVVKRMMRHSANGTGDALLIGFKTATQVLRF